MSRGKGMDLIELIRREIYTSMRRVWNIINVICRVVNISSIYIGIIDIPSFAYIGLFGLITPNTGIDKEIIICFVWKGCGGSMSMGGTLEFIQSFNNPKIIHASDRSLEMCSFTVGGSFSLSSEMSSNCLNFPLKWNTNCSVVL